MKIQIDTDRCEGHGRCYSLAPELIEADELGNGREIGDGAVPPALETVAAKAVANCPEHAVILEQGA